MRKIGFTLLIVFASVLAYSQNELGFRIGANHNYARVDGIAESLKPDIKMLDGLILGMFYKIDLLNNFSFVPGVKYSEKGFTVDEGLDVDIFGADLPLGVRAETHSYYIEVPALFRYTIPSGIGEFYFEGGPTLGYATAAEIRTKARAILDFNLMTTDLNLNNDIYNRWEVSGQVGAGVAVIAGPGKLFANVRYQHGFTDMLDNPTIDIRLKNRNINWGVGYAYTFGAKAGQKIPLRP